MKSLVFAYAADSGRLNTLLDSAHKLLSPSTYSCRLCLLTHGLRSEKKEWTEFIKKLELPAEFLHRDELKLKYPGVASIELPAVFLKRGNELRGFATAAELKSCESLEALIALVRGKLQAPRAF